MNPSNSKPEASSSSSTPFRRLDGDINREAGMPLTGQKIVGEDNKARGVNCLAHGSISVIGRRREMEDRLTGSSGSSSLMGAWCVPDQKAKKMIKNEVFMGN